MNIPFFQGVINQTSRMFKNTGFYKHMTNPEMGEQFMQRSVSYVKPALGYASRRGLIMGGMMQAHLGRSVWGGAGKAAAINASIGGVYGGMTDQSNPLAGAAKGAAIGAGLGLAGRAGVWGATQLNGREFGSSTFKVGLHPKFTSGVSGLYGKAVTKAWSS